MALPQTNATLTSVARGGQREEPGASRAAGAGADVFSGSVRVYYREKRERVTTPAGRDVLVSRTLVVETRAPAIEWLEDDVVTFTRDRDRDNPITSKVQNVEAAELEEIAASGVETTRVELEPK